MGKKMTSALEFIQEAASTDPIQDLVVLGQTTKDQMLACEVLKTQDVADTYMKYRFISMKMELDSHGLLVIDQSEWTCGSPLRREARHRWIDRGCNTRFSFSLTFDPSKLWRPIDCLEQPERVAFCMIVMKG